jgi:hypothetical protein
VTVPGTFRAAVEAKDLAAITAALAPSVEFHSPVVVKPYRGRDAVRPLLEVLLETMEDFRYTDELVGVAPMSEPPSQALIFSARIMDTSIQGLDLITFDDAGLVDTLTVMVRPLPAAMTLARVVGKRMEQRHDEPRLHT